MHKILAKVSLWLFGSEYLRLQDMVDSHLLSSSSSSFSSSYHPLSFLFFILFLLVFSCFLLPLLSLLSLCKEYHCYVLCSPPEAQTPRIPVTFPVSSPVTELRDFQLWSAPNCKLLKNPKRKFPRHPAPKFPIYRNSEIIHSWHCK